MYGCCYTLIVAGHTCDMVPRFPCLVLFIHALIRYKYIVARAKIVGSVGRCCTITVAVDIVFAAVATWRTQLQLMRMQQRCVMYGRALGGRHGGQDDIVRLGMHQRGMQGQPVEYHRIWKFAIRERT
jgi:hypothetical protein